MIPAGERVPMAAEGQSRERAGDALGEHAAFLGTKTFGSLDGLRAASILAVVWHHTHGGVGAWPVTQRGFLGVDLFFVISGFLIVTLLLRERRRSGTTSLKRFYIRRFLRIFPPYYATLFAVGALAYLVPGGNELRAIRHDLPYALLYVANLFPMQSLLAITWSLSVEEQFYLIVPALERLAKPVFVGILAVAFVVVSLPAFGFMSSLDLPEFFRQTTFGPILLGVMLAEVLDAPRGYRLVSRFVGHRFAPVAALVLVFAACCNPSPDISGWPRLLIHATLLVLVAACVIREDHVLATPLAFWPLRRIGAVSYGIYLYHMMIRHFATLALARAGLGSGVAFFVATALGTWLVAEISYRLFESRFLALKGRWT